MSRFLVFTKKDFSELTPLMKAATVTAWLALLCLISVLAGPLVALPKDLSLILLTAFMAFLGLTHLISLISGFRDGRFMMFPFNHFISPYETLTKRDFSFWFNVFFNAFFAFAMAVFLRHAPVLFR